MSVYASKSVKRAADFIDSPLPEAVKFAAVVYTIGALGAARLVAKDAVDAWANAVQNEVEMRENNDMIDCMAPWSRSS